MDTGEDNEKALLEDAKERQIYDPIDKIFDHSKKRVTDLQECAEVYLPKPVDEKYECEMEIIRNVILEEFNSYKEKIERNIERNNKKTGRNQAPEMNQEGINLSMNERKGLKKLQKRIQKGEIAIIKTDKSGKTTAISKEDYLKMGREANSSDKKVDRKERKNIEKQINAHTRMLVKIMNMGESHGHLQRILDSKLTNSEQAAPKYFMFKDHKEGGGMETSGLRLLL